MWLWKTDDLAYLPKLFPWQGKLPTLPEGHLGNFQSQCDQLYSLCQREGLFSFSGMVFAHTTAYPDKPCA